MREIGSSAPSPVKPVTLNIDIHSFLAWHSALTRLHMDWFARGQNNITEWDTGPWLISQHYKVISQYSSWYDPNCCKDTNLEQPRSLMKEGRCVPGTGCCSRIGKAHITKGLELNTSRVTPKALNSCNCHYLSQCLRLTGYYKDCLTQCQNNEVVYYSLLWGQWPDFPVGHHLNSTALPLSQVGTIPHLTLNVARR